MTQTFRLLAATIAIALFVSPVDAKKKASAPPPPAACADFFGHIKTPWLRSNPLPPGDASRSQWDELNELGKRQRESLFTSPQQNAGPAQNKLNALMQSADENRIKADSEKILEPMLAEIDKIKKPKDVSTAIAYMHARGLPILFGFDADNDNTFSANAIGLPDPGFYTRQDSAITEAQGRYRTYIETLLVLNGVPSEKIKTSSGHVFSIEMQLAAVSGPSPAQLISVKDAGKQYANLQFANYLRTQKNGSDKIVLAQPAFFKSVNGLINAKMIEHWKSYLRFHALDQLSPYLNDPYFSAHGQFHEVYLAGRTTPKSYTQNMRDLIEAHAPELIDAAYAERYIDSVRRQRARKITDSIVQAAEQAITRSTWVANEGEQRDLKILKELKVDIGRDAKSFSSIDIGDSYASSSLKLLSRGKAGKDRHNADAWPDNISDSAPLVVYIAKDNRIIITNALLQPPVFDAEGSAKDYGALGALFAQQLSLALYQSTLKNVTALNAQRSSIISQYNGYTLSGKKKVNGTLTATQNLADLSGLEFAFQAFMASGTHDKNAQQDFFRAWANLWGRVDRDSALLASYDKAVHAPAKWRVNGPLANMSAFGNAFSCKAGPMQRPYKEQLKLWP